MWLNILLAFISCLICYVLALSLVKIGTPLKRTILPTVIFTALCYISKVNFNASAQLQTVLVTALIIRYVLLSRV